MKVIHLVCKTVDLGYLVYGAFENLEDADKAEALLIGERFGREFEVDTVQIFDTVDEFMNSELVRRYVE